MLLPTLLLPSTRFLRTRNLRPRKQPQLDQHPQRPQHNHQHGPRLDTPRAKHAPVALDLENWNPDGLNQRRRGRRRLHLVEQARLGAEQSLPSKVHAVKGARSHHLFLGRAAGPKNHGPGNTRVSVSRRRRAQVAKMQWNGHVLLSGGRKLHQPRGTPLVHNPIGRFQVRFSRYRAQAHQIVRVEELRVARGQLVFVREYGRWQREICIQPTCRLRIGRGSSCR